MRIGGRTAVVTGASSGIGRSTALLLARRGARVVAVGRNRPRLEAVAALHDAVHPVVADVSDPAGRARILAEAEDRAGPVDILVNNAGIGWAGSLARMPADDVRQLFETNVLGLVDLTQRALPGMLARRRGHVSNVGSVVGFVAVPPLGVYSATKWAVQGYTDALRRELLGTGVTATCVNPGPVASRFLPRAAVADREEVAGAPTGVPPWLVAFAIERGIRFGRLPGFGSIAVPRVVGMARLAEVPGVRAAVDLGSGVAARIFRAADLGP